MRSHSVHALMPGARIVLTVDPPIALDEKPFVLAIRGKQSIVVEPIDTERVAITNPTSTISLVYFFVTTKTNGEQFPLGRLLGMLGGL